MKRRYFSVMALAITLAFITSVTPVYAIGNNSNNFENIYIEELLNEIISETNTYSIIDSMKLNKFGSDSTYTLFKLSPMGYAIMDDVSGEFEEISCYSENVPYEFNSGKNYYYGGPLSYYEKQNNCFINLSDESILENDALENIILLEENIYSSRQAEKMISTRASYERGTYSVNQSSYFPALTSNDYGNNVNNTCTHIACAIMLGYFDTYLDERYVPLQYETANGGTTEAFHQYLQTFLGSQSCGLRDASNRLGSYFEEINFWTVTINCKIGNHLEVYDTVVSSIANNRPVVAAMFTSYNSACPYNHSVVVYKYNVMTTDSVYYTVHTGWYSDPIKTFSYDWFADCIYLT